MRKLGSLAVIIGSLACASDAWAIPDFNVADGVLASQNRESTFLASLGSFTRETFNGSALTTAPTLTSAVGTFTSTTAGQQGQIISIASGSIDGRGLTPFSGNYLESRDSAGVSWHATSGTQFNAIGFYVQDAGDQGALLNIRANDGTTGSATIQGADGNTKYVVINFDRPVSDVAIDFVNTGSNVNSDGWGLDNITIGRLISTDGRAVPEPASVATLAAGLAGLGLLMRRRRPG